jgi:tyrosine-protein phosphatase SIW14
MNFIYSIIILVLVLVASSFITGCASRPKGPATQSWSAPDDHRFAGVENFNQVTPTLWRGSQPTAEGFANLAKAGVKTIINLRSEHDDLPLLQDTSLQYLRIPMRAWNPNQGDEAQLILVMKTLERLLASPASSPVFIHCAAGRDRTGYSIASFRMIYQNWSANDAILEMFDYHFNTLWFRNPAFLRKLNVDHVKTLLQRAP